MPSHYYNHLLPVLCLVSSSSSSAATKAHLCITFASSIQFPFYSIRSLFLPFLLSTSLEANDSTGKLGNNARLEERLADCGRISEAGIIIYAEQMPDIR